MSTIHLPPRELVKRLRIENMKKQHVIDNLLGVNALRQEIVELCCFLAYKGGGTVTITPDDLKILDKCEVHKNTDKETGTRTYRVELRKEESEKEEEKKEEPILKAVK